MLVDDAARTGIPASTLAGYGVTGHGTVASTKSDHLARYGFADF
jgi:hypothetical protein